MLSKSLGKSSQNYSTSQVDKGPESHLLFLTGTLSQLVSKPKLPGNEELIDENTLNSLNLKTFETYL